MTIILFLLVLFSTLYFSMTKLRAENPFHVYLLSYTYFLGWVSSAVLMIVSHKIGAVDKDAHFIGVSGQFIKYIFEYCTDIQGEMVLLFIVFTMVFLPQALAYALSGLFGCAYPIVFIGFLSSAAFWLLIKSIVFFAGFIFPVGLAGCIFGWPTYNIHSVFSSLTISLLFFTLSIYMIIMKTGFMKDNNIIEDRYRRYFGLNGGYATKHTYNKNSK